MISRPVRQTVRAIYAFACGYCGTTETNAGAELTIDHFIPQSHGGTDDLDNLVYCCHACNNFKGSSWDPTTPPVLHPLHTTMALHFTEDAAGVLQPLTDDGARHIALLHLNREPLILQRIERTRNLKIAERQTLHDARILALERSMNAFKRPPVRRPKKRR